MQQTEAALCCIFELVFGRAAEFSAPGTQMFEEQGKLFELCRHIRVRLVRLPSRSAGSPSDFVLSSVSLSVTTGEGLQTIEGLQTAPGRMRSHPAGPLFRPAGRRSA